MLKYLQDPESNLRCRAATVELVLVLLGGFGFGLSLIVAIGAQNAFVLRQGLRGEHVALVVAVCAVSDAILIAAGVAGAGALLREGPPGGGAGRVRGGAPPPGCAPAAPPRRPAARPPP